MKKIVLSLLIISLLQLVKAQNVVKCFTDEIHAAFLAQNPELAKEEALANQTALLTQNLHKKGVVRYIPVVFHVLHKYGFENISQTQINDAIRVLNEDFRKKTGTNGGASTDPLATDMEYEFRLAQFDPNGSPTNGVNRIYTTKTDDSGDNAKSLSYWDKNRFFNIWVVNSIYNSGSGTILGYAQFPFAGSASTDGVMIRADQCGVIEVGVPSQAGRTLTHEAGHWVGLYHPFQGGCVGNTSSNCSSQGDWVCDTPPVASSSNGCQTTRNSCTNDIPDKQDLVRNYMDYSDGTCMNMFTAGQKTRVDPMMSNYRAYVTNPANVFGAGVNSDGTYKALIPSARKAPYSYGFESSNITADGWKLENYTCPGDSGWNLYSNAALSGQKCAAALNNKTTRLNVRNAIVSPVIDISTLSNPTLTVYVAYAKKLTVSNERLRIFVSNSHGREEIMAKMYVASDLETVPMQSADFIPNNAAQWKKLTLDLTAFKDYTNFSARLELQNLRGNNIFIDDFSITNTTGIEEELKNALKFNVYPNPTSGLTNIEFSLNQTQQIKMEMFDLSGRLVKQIANNPFNGGLNKVELQTESLVKGIYFINVETVNGSFSHKLLIN